MAKTLSYRPPGRAADAPRRGPVRRRHVLYVPGYDHEAKSRSRSLFVREVIRYGKRFGLSERTIGKVQDLPDVPAIRWTVRAAKDEWATETTYDVLRWDDIVERDFRQPMPKAVFWLVLGTLDALLTGLVVRLYRMNWIFASVVIYPFAMVALLGLGALAAGCLTGWLTAAAGMPGWAGLLAGAGAAAGTVALARSHYGRFYVWHLLHDFLFNWRHGNGSRPDYDARVDALARHLGTVVAGTTADEVLIVGHSSGAGMAIEIVAGALALDPDLGRSGPEVAVLTIGTSLPVAAMNVRAEALRRRIARIAREPGLLWVEYQAPQDWLNAAGFNPVRMLPLGLAEEACANPVIRSAKFTEITSDKTYRAMLKSPFRMHFQFMMANDRPGEYDFIMMLLGPMRLSERIADPDAAAALAGVVQGRAEGAGPEPMDA